MDKELKAKWVDALRANTYKQARETLKDEDGAMCCLGVLCEVQQADWEAEFPTDDDLNTSQLPPRLSAGLTEREMSILADMNDSEKRTFPEIASYIEAAL